MHINYFDLGLWKTSDEIDIMVEKVFPKFQNITYSVYGIEAYKPYCDDLEKKYINNKNVKIYNLAINDCKKDVFLYMADNAGLGNSIFESKNNVKRNDKHCVAGNTFSNWLIENNINLEKSINILKLNIEGAELFFWEDIKKSNLKDKFNIFCGHPDHDITKVGELKDKINYYHELLKELKIEIKFLCRTDHNLSETTMTNCLTEILNRL
jgi:FkbM family methyltransferase